MGGQAVEVRGIKFHVCFPRHAGRLPSPVDPVSRKWPNPPKPFAGL